MACDVVVLALLSKCRNAIYLHTAIFQKILQYAMLHIGWTSHAKLKIVYIIYEFEIESIECCFLLIASVSATFVWMTSLDNSNNLYWWRDSLESLWAFHFRPPYVLKLLDLWGVGSKGDDYHKVLLDLSFLMLVIGSHAGFEWVSCNIRVPRSKIWIF